MKTKPVAYSYIRFSTPEQLKGDSLRRQTEAAKVWCVKHGVRLDEVTTFRDLGKSAYTGTHRTNPDRHALAAFLKLVEQGKVPRGSYLIIENLDRLTREHIQPAMLLALNLLQGGIRIVQLKPSEMVFDDRSEGMAVMMMVMELSRGHGESAMKSERLGKAWDAKRAAIGARKLTGKCPFWLKLSEDSSEFVEKPEAVKTVKFMFRLAREGYGSTALARRLNEEGILSPYGRLWNNVSVLSILQSRSVLGEYTPHRGNPGKRKPVGQPIIDYYPRVIGDDEFWAVQNATKLRKHQRGPRGKNVRNLFTELARDARDGSPLHVIEKNKGDLRLIPSGAIRGKGGSKYHSFSYATFEKAFLSLLAEVDPREVLGQEEGPDEVMALSGELANVEAKLAELEAELLKGDSATLAKVVRQLEARKGDLAARLTEARATAANPLSEAWGECQSLLAAIDSAPDQEEARSRLRSILRRIVSEILVLIVPCGPARARTRLAAVQVWFADGRRRRDYLILHRSPGTGRPAGWWARSLSDLITPDGLDLRNRTHVRRLDAALTALEIDLAE